MSFVELHFHLLPGVDDGPRSMEESISLATAAVSDGTGVVVTTPHVHPQHITDPSYIPERTRELSARLRHERIPLSVLPGGELDHTMVERLTPGQLEQIAQGPAGARWLLLETPFEGPSERFADAADELRAQGYRIVVAHPERVLWTAATTAIVERELALGSIVQLTAGSFTGSLGDSARGLAYKLVRSAPHVVIASDAHGGIRMPGLRPALRALTKAGERHPARFVEAIPRALLERGVGELPPARAA